MARVTVETTDGRRITEEVTHRLGSPENPLSRDAVIAKFDTLAGTVLSPNGVKAVKEKVFAIDQSSDVSDLIALIS